MQIGEKMDILHDFDSELALVFNTCRTHIASYPVEFNADACRRLEKLNPLRQDYRGNCLSQLLPFWLQPVFSLNPDLCRRISVANVFGFLYFLIQDAVMDTTPGEYKADLLPVGNLFFLDFFEQYRQLFPDDSPFWSYFRKYLQEWAESVIQERKGYWQGKRDFDTADLVQLAHKAAPLKITVAAVCLLSGREATLELLTQAVDATVITFQLMDDWDDWREDLAIGNCSFFLSQVMRVCKIAEFAELKELHIQRAVYGYDLLNSIFIMGEKNLAFLNGETMPQVPYLIQYNQDLLQTSRKILQDIQEEKNAMLQGGFSHWLYQRGKVQNNTTY